MYCQNCGKEVSGNFCQNCGKAVNAPPAPPNNYYAPAPKAKQDRSTAFKVFSVLSSIFCGLSLVAYWFSAASTSVSATLLATHFIGICLFFVMSNILAIKIQPAKQGLSVIFYSLSCIGLLFIALMGFQYSLAVLAICIVTVILIILTGVFGATATKIPMQKRKIIIIAVILLALSIATYGGARIANAKQNARLSEVTINGITPTKEQLDIIDEDYVLRRSLHRELYKEKLDDLNYTKSDNQSDTLPGTEYFTSNYPECKYLQIDNSSLSFGLWTATVYNITYKPVKLDDENLKNVVEVYATVFDREFALENTSYTFDEIVSTPVPTEGTLSYHSVSSPEDETQIEITITVNQNGYATLSVMYLFPVENQQIYGD